MGNTIRQGDMVLLRISKSEVKNKKSVRKDSLTVGVGETSGHKHLIRPVGSNVELLEYANSTENLSELDIFVDREEIFFEVKGGNAIIRHEEHDAIILTPGFYKRFNQISYNPFEKRLQKVKD